MVEPNIAVSAKHRVKALVVDLFAVAPRATNVFDDKASHSHEPTDYHLVAILALSYERRILVHGFSAA
jgi:hypothetical protein